MEEGDWLVSAGRVSPCLPLVVRTFCPFCCSGCLESSWQESWAAVSSDFTHTFNLSTLPPFFISLSPPPPRRKLLMALLVKKK